MRKLPLFLKITYPKPLRLGLSRMLELTKDSASYFNYSGSGDLVQLVLMLLMKGYSKHIYSIPNYAIIM